LRLSLTCCYSTSLWRTRRDHAIRASGWFAALRTRIRTTSVLVTHDLHEAVLLATHIA